MLSAKKSFEQAGLEKKVEKLKAMQQKVDNEASSLEKQTRNKQAKLAKDQAEIKVRERKQEVAEVEFASASYNQWKAKEEREAAKAKFEHAYKTREMKLLKEKKLWATGKPVPKE